eukprot:m.13076 g.13076  ORF g.13076 m.13076 type:complete len:211 (+) comp6121_c0_seq1:27-659(+)
MARRGLLIVFEGTDRCGKSTQCRRLVQNLTDAKIPAELWRFPDRTTRVGGLINEYLTCKSELDDHTAHLLFSANRWEKKEEMLQKLRAGVTLVLDRYAFSGVAFTAAKGLSIDWCRTPDAGLPAPDLLLHFVLPVAEAQQRGGYGEERYEKAEFQARVQDKFKELYASMQCVPATIVDVSGLDETAVEAVVRGHVDAVLAGPPSELKTLW